MTDSPLALRLSAVILTVSNDRPQVMLVADEDALPSGSLADGDETLELALRRLVEEQAGSQVGYVEQLYTFGDLRRSPGSRTISIAYLALVGEGHALAGRWQDCYELFPWEDWRDGKPEVIDSAIVPALVGWAGDSADRRERGDIAFGLGGSRWDPARVLERYELLYEVGLVAEAARDRNVEVGEPLGRHLVSDHRRIVATALGRLRGKLTYRPVVFELLTDTFTLGSLQSIVEALTGIRLHKPNFRRLLERSGIVEGTGIADPHTGGRPAELFRFRREVLRERPAPGVGLPGAG